MKWKKREKKNRNRKQLDNGAAASGQTKECFTLKHLAHTLHQTIWMHGAGSSSRMIKTLRIQFCGGISIHRMAWAGCVSLRYIFYSPLFDNALAREFSSRVRATNKTDSIFYTFVAVFFLCLFESLCAVRCHQQLQFQPNQLLTPTPTPNETSLLIAEYADKKKVIANAKMFNSNKYYKLLLFQSKYLDCFDDA